VKFKNYSSGNLTPARILSSRARKKRVFYGNQSNKYHKTSEGKMEKKLKSIYCSIRVSVVPAGPCE